MKYIRVIPDILTFRVKYREKTAAGNQYGSICDTGIAAHNAIYCCFIASMALLFLFTPIAHTCAHTYRPTCIRSALPSHAERGETVLGRKQSERQF